ncbi:MAG: hypothetical protein ACE5R6_17445 [Candidatus Heimdallarchaeota archaeon]
MEAPTFILDTTYILPFFGIDIDVPGLKRDMETLLTKKKRKIRFVVSSCSMIEAKWIVLSEYRKTRNPEVLDRYMEASLSLIWGKQVQLHHSFLDESTNSIADRLWILGHQDLMDCWIAGSAAALNGTLITEDDVLKAIMRECSETREIKTFTWDEFLRTL